MGPTGNSIVPKGPRSVGSQSTKIPLGSAYFVHDQQTQARTTLAAVELHTAHFQTWHFVRCDTRPIVTDSEATVTPDDRDFPVGSFHRILGRGGPDRRIGTAHQ